MGSRYRPQGGAHRRAATRVRRAAGVASDGASWGRCCWSGLVILLQLNRLAQVLGVASLLLVALYPLAKRVTWWPQLMMGFTFGFGAPLGYAAAAGRIDAAWARAVRRGDPVGSRLRHDLCPSGPRGRRPARHRLDRARVRRADPAVPGRLLCRDADAAGAVRVGGGLDAWFYPALALPAALLARQVAVLDINDPANCLRQFRANREAGLAVGLAILLGWI